MNQPTQSVAIDDASAGMILGADLCDAGGAVLLPAGTSLSDAALASLRRRGIEQLQVEAEAEPDSPADSAALQAERERQCLRLERLFRRCGSEGATGELYHRLINYRKGL